MKKKVFKVIVGAAVAIGITQLCGHLQAQATNAPLAASSVPAAQLMQPEALSKALNATGAARPLILQVGSKLMFDQAHIPGSEYVGPGSREDGLNLLRQRVKMLPKNSYIVLYCGCCPWDRCPNVGNAFKTMQEMGFTNVKVVYFATNFGTDWVNKGYPVAQ
jgi:thiosulfate/3-mercaptopyruvate sulfurtransferase